MGSCEFCGLYIRTCNLGHSTRRHERYHWVCLPIQKACKAVLTYSAILASFLLDEKLGRLGICGCASCIVSPLLSFLSSL